MTLAQILADLYRRTNHPTSPASAVTTRLTAYVNEGLQELYSLPGLGAWVTQHVPPLTFASVASTATYTLPPGVARIESITEATNYRRLSMQSRDWYYAQQPDPTSSTGTPDTWIPLGWSAVAVQPSNASEIFIKSTSASDTNTVYIEGIRTGGYPVSLSTTMTGTTAKSLSASFTDIAEVTKFYVSAAAIGSITLHEDSGVGTELARIPIGQTFARYQQIALYPTPASAITYTVHGERDTPDMSQTVDEPMIPARFHRLLVDYALWKEWEKVDDTRAQGCQQRWQKGVSDLKYFLTCPPDYLPVSGRGQTSGRSRLGGWYPAD